MARKKESITGLEYGLGWASFLPVLGLFTGVAALVLGANKLKAGGAKLAVLALAGILFNLLAALPMARFAFRHYSSVAMPSVYQTLSKRYLKETVMALEYYKLVHGAYPTGLDELKGDGTNTYLHDASAGLDLAKIRQPHAYTLQKGGLHYQLMDAGPDGVTGTADDIYPVMGPEELARTGYVGPAVAR